MFESTHRKARTTGNKANKHSLFACIKFTQHFEEYLNGTTGMSIAVTGFRIFAKSVYTEIPFAGCFTGRSATTQQFIQLFGRKATQRLWCNDFTHSVTNRVEYGCHRINQMKLYCLIDITIQIIDGYGNGRTVRNEWYGEWFGGRCGGC